MAVKTATPGLHADHLAANCNSNLVAGATLSVQKSFNWMKRLALQNLMFTFSVNDYSGLAWIDKLRLVSSCTSAVRRVGTVWREPSDNGHSLTRCLGWHADGEWNRWAGFFSFWRAPGDFA
jgi:hypothetical protein